MIIDYHILFSFDDIATPPPILFGDAALFVQMTGPY